MVVAALVGCGHVSKRNDGNASVGGAAASGGNGSSGSGGLTPSGGALTEPPACSLSAPPEVPLRALGASALQNELAQLGQSLDGEVYPEPSSLIYDDQEPNASATFVSGHAAFVQGLVRRVTADAAGLGKLLGCDVKAAAQKCQAKLFEFVVARLFRGQTSAETEAELQQVFDMGQGLDGDFQGGARAVLEVALQSPEFLYRVEVGRPVEGAPADWSRPTDVEMASRLSFLLWDRGPDDELLAAAARGELTDPADIEAQARRMLADERARAGVRRFYRELLRLTGAFPEGHASPELTPEIVALMDEEFNGFVERATFDGPGDYQALFSPSSWLNGPLASYYGLPGVKGEAFRAVELDATRYAGLLTQPAWLVRPSSATWTSPSTRGWIAAGAFLCQVAPLKPPDAIVTVQPPQEPPALTTRERLAEHASSPACAGCHQLIDPIGLALEHFDGAGRYRETEGGLAIDTRGHWAPSGPTFEGAAELGALLASEDTARSCFVSQWARFAFGRAEEQRNECARAELLEQFSHDPSVPELLVALTQTDSFRFRKAQP